MGAPPGICAQVPCAVRGARNSLAAPEPGGVLLGLALTSAMLLVVSRGWARREAGAGWRDSVSTLGEEHPWGPG